MISCMDKAMRSRSLRLRSLKHHVRRPAIVGMVALYLLAAAVIAAKFFRAHPGPYTTDWAQHFIPNVTSMAPTHLRSGGSKIQRSTKPPGEPEIWAQGPVQMSSVVIVLRDLLDADVTKQLRSLCGRCLYRTLTSYVRAQDHGVFTVVLTGDIPAVWLRDSAVQMATYIPRVARRPAMRQTLEGAIRAQAYFILQVRCRDLSVICQEGAAPLSHPFSHRFLSGFSGSLGQCL
jgi:hypothetical protein